MPVFFHKWLDPKLPENSKVGIQAVKFQGVSDYLENVADKLEFYLEQNRANFVVGLVDLYGLPSDKIDLSGSTSTREKVRNARQEIIQLIPSKYRTRFRQHFAVHEIEAWLLAYPEKWPDRVRDQIRKKPPEEVNSHEPPAKSLKRILDGSYKKAVNAKNIFPNVQPEIAIEKCPFLKLLAQDLLEIAKRLQ